MDYFKSNKEAWEEAFEKRSSNWGEDVALRLEKEPYPFLEAELVNQLKELDFNNKVIGQFCCNNGRELLSMMKFGAKKGVGFDIAQNLVDTANDLADKANKNCHFEQANILEISEEYHDYFDYILIAIGVLTWFEDLNLFFNKAASCLKEGGKIIIHEIHPVTGMIATQNEPLYDSNTPKNIVYSYFRDEPWIENSGVGYMNEGNYPSKTFYSYSHTLGEIINEISTNKLVVKKLLEFDKDISSQFTHVSQQGIPLSYILIAEK